MSARKYIRHIPRDFAMPANGMTHCGRKVDEVNCVLRADERDAPDVCMACNKWMVRLVRDIRRLYK